MIQRVIELGGPVVVYANRRMLIDQLSKGLTAAGIEHGIMAAGYAEETQHDVQIASIQTVERRWKAGKMHLHPASIVFIDEAHNERGGRIREVIDAHVEQGAAVIGVTATPVGIGDIYSELIQAGTTSELRECGALVPANTFAPDEPDAKAYKSKVMGVMQYRDEIREVMMHAVFGRVYEHYRTLNPQGKPAIGFAPGVEESQWFAEQFVANGINAAHIDGEKIWLEGQTIGSDRESRAMLRSYSEEGRIEIVWNRFVLREGVDWPHLAHGVFACTFGGICSYLQAGGRLLRAHPSLSAVTIQDHGGNYWRHDSLNADREWSLDDTERKIANKHEELYRTKAEPEPIVCPKCSKVRAGGATCPKCGFAYRGKVRRVIQHDGSLREVRGDIYRPRRVSKDPEDVKTWKSCYYRAKNSRRGMTFNQARALFQQEAGGRVPSSDFPLVPLNSADWSLPVKDVPRERLTGSRQASPA